LKKLYIIAALALVLIVFAGCTSVCADVPVPAVTETQGFTTTTSMAVAGTATETDAYTWQLSNLALDSPPLGAPGIIPLGPYIVVPHIPILDPLFGGTLGEVQYAVTYSEDTIADQGLVAYQKTSSLDTANKVANQQNLQTDKIIEFIGFETGRAVSSEDLLVDGAGQFGLTESLFLCPFVSNDPGITPQFCNIVEMGSTTDMTLMSLASSAGERHVSAMGDVPVEAEYAVKVTGFGTIPATGSVNAVMNTHLQEGRAFYIATFPFGDDSYADMYSAGKVEDLIYSEDTSAIGEVALFDKEMSYQSGVRRV
jgi:hypothetical protein